MTVGSCESGALLTSFPHPLALSPVWTPSLWGVPSFWTGDFLRLSLLDQGSQTVRPLMVRCRLYCVLAAHLSGRGPMAMVPYFPLPTPQGLSRVLLLWYLYFKTQTLAPFSSGPLLGDLRCSPLSLSTGFFCGGCCRLCSQGFYLPQCPASQVQVPRATHPSLEKLPLGSDVPSPG